MTGFAAYGSLRHVGRGVLLALLVLPLIWVLFIASGTSFGPAVDDPKDFFITLLNGLTAAALYFVVASGFTLIFGLMRVVNMAHGAFFLLGGYVALRTQRNMVGGDVGLGLSSAQVSLAQWVVPALAGVAVVAGVGLLMQQLFLRWNQGQDLRQALITIAIAIILADQMLAHYGGVAQDISWPGTFDKFVDLHIYDIQYTMTRLVILGIGLVIGGALWFWLQKTRSGMVIRAGVDDRDMVSAMGINIQLTFAIAFVVGSALAGFGGVIGGSFASLAPGVDANWLLNSLVVVIIGGLYRLEGAWLGAFVFVVINNYAPDIDAIGDRFHTLIGVIFLVIVLVSPNGLIGLWERATAGRRRTIPGDIAQERGSAQPTPVG